MQSSNASNTSLTKLHLQITPTSAVSPEFERAICLLLEQAYPHSSMPTEFKRKILPANGLVCYYSDQKLGIIAVRCFRLCVEDLPAQIKKIAPNGIPFGATGTVAPQYRRYGLGRRLISESNEHVFVNYNAHIIGGSSWAMGALRLYGRLGALYLQQDIDQLTAGASVDENRAFFARFMSDPFWTNLRFGDDVQYFWTRGESERSQLLANGCTELAAILNCNN